MFCKCWPPPPSNSNSGILLKFENIATSTQILSYSITTRRPPQNNTTNQVHAPILLKCNYKLHLTTWMKNIKSLFYMKIFTRHSHPTKCIKLSERPTCVIYKHSALVPHWGVLHPSHHFHPRVRQKRHLALEVFLGFLTEKQNNLHNSQYLKIGN